MTRTLLAAMLAVFVVHAAAQSYPSRPVKIVVPATPGGAIDLIARTLGDKLTGSLGQPVVVENKPGAANNLGTDYVAKSPPDGYTLLIIASSHATNKHLYKNLPYDPVKDFEPVVYTHVVPLLLAVHPSVPAKNVQELTAWVKANPDKAIYASSGPGSSLHMAAELYMSMTGTKMHHVPYKGSSAAHPDLLAGRTAMIFDTITAVRGHVKAGTLRGIAVTTLKRSSSMPELPTIAESGCRAMTHRPGAASSRRPARRSQSSPS
jgi:tripartite-type tricarboxylate transporter receptor subunit TctC